LSWVLVTPVRRYFAAGDSNVDTGGECVPIQDADGFVRAPSAATPNGAGRPGQTGQLYPRLV